VSLKRKSVAYEFRTCPVLCNNGNIMMSLAVCICFLMNLFYVPCLNRSLSMCEIERLGDGTEIQL
jgi:hypothetical protein